MALSTAFVAMTSACGLPATSGNQEEDDKDGGKANAKPGALASAVPATLAVASTTAAQGQAKTAGSAAEAVFRAYGLRGSTPIANANEGQDFASKIARMEAALSATSLEACTAVLPDAITVKNAISILPECYGPAVSYENHPDWSSSWDPEGRQKNGTLPPGDLGIWSASEGNEACAAATLNALVDNVALQADLGTGVSVMLMCAAQQAGKTLPAVGEDLDLSEILGDADTGVLKLATATLSRTKDTAAGKPVYETRVTGTVDEAELSVLVRHSPSDESNAEYSGLVQVTIEGANMDPSGGAMPPPDGNMPPPPDGNMPPPPDGNMPPPPDGNMPPPNGGQGSGKRALSIAYARQDGMLTYRMSSALFADTSTSVFDSTGELVRTASRGSTTGWHADFASALVSIDEEGIGRFAYVWQAGGGDGYTRTFNVETRSDDTATAYFGYTQNPSDGGDWGPFRIDTFFCNWLFRVQMGISSGGMPSDDASFQVSKAQRQNLTYDGTAWIVDPAAEQNIQYAPTFACSYDGQGGASFDGATGAIEDQLIDLESDYDFEVPKLPPVLE